jgi:hypothetical membrane protein
MTTLVRTLAWAGILAPLLRLGLIGALGAAHPSYSQTRDFISELGAPDAPFAALMNFVGISTVGALLVLFCLPLRRTQPQGPLRTIGTLLLGISGTAFIAVGLLPCDQPGCAMDAPSRTMQAHLLAGLMAMTAQSLAALAFGIRLFTGTGSRWYAGVSLALGCVAVLALATLFGSGSRLPMPGLAQKLMQVSADVWVLLSAIFVLRSARPGAQH